MNEDCQHEGTPAVSVPDDVQCAHVSHEPQSDSGIHQYRLLALKRTIAADRRAVRKGGQIK